MINLIKLEFKKNKFGWYSKGLLIANPIILLFICVINYLEMLEGNDVLSSVNEAFSMLGILSRVVIIIFAAVLLSKLIIREYNSNTISVLFTYPVQRKKIIWAKIAIVCGMTFTALLLSQLFLDSAFIIVNHYYNFVPATLDWRLIQSELLTILVQSLASTGISLIPLYFGLRKKSVTATIVSAVIVGSLLNSNTAGFSLSSILIIPIILGVIGVAIAYLSFRDVDTTDIV
ncbi:ABC transporter permease [Paenibacillaceae bacterium]|nr:ABC transporter permease [Paenibacillaceae bacterium]